MQTNQALLAKLKANWQAQSTPNRPSFGPSPTWTPPRRISRAF